MMRATDIVTRLNLKRHPRSWRGRCPNCGYAGNTLVVKASKVGWAQLYCANGCTRDELAEAVAHATGHQHLGQRDDSRVVERRQRNSERALALWLGSESAIDTLADKYLTERGLTGLAASSALRFRGDTPHPEGGRLPALIALVCNVSGAPVAIHRTFLARDGSKSCSEPAKASLGTVWTGAVRLDPIATGTPLAIGEGIESSASAGRLMGLPAWAAVSAGNLANALQLPPEARSVVIAADPDWHGREAARAAWHRWKAEGRDVRIAIPDREKQDFNDLLLTREAANA
jgi:hypothetical protein